MNPLASRRLLGGQKRDCSSPTHMVWIKSRSASRQSVYNWFAGGEVFVAYRPVVEALLSILKTSPNADVAWRSTCKTFDLTP